MTQQTVTLFDTHTHLYLPEFHEGGAPAVERALEAGVGYMMFPNVSLETVGPMRELHAAYPGNTFMAMGLHPTEVGEDWENHLAETERILRSEPLSFKAVGEIGIDLYWDTTYRQEQLEVFRRQCLWALEFDLPVIIHCREGLAEVLEVLRSLPAVPAGIFHSFGGTPEDVEAIRSAGDFYFGINGTATFKKSTLPATLPVIPLDRLLLETDSPYLAPVPKRGRRNESAYIVHTAQFVADVLRMPLERLAQVTLENSKKIFGIP